jgi:DNA-3-methyladenine glycosylase II
VTVELQTIWTGGRRKLGKDRVFGPWVKQVGSIRVPVSGEPPFYYLVRAIVFQQLAGAAARTIHGRVIEALGGDVSPAKVLRVRDATLRKAGLSGNKLAAIRDLAAKVKSGEVDVSDLEDQTDEEVTRRLTTVKGIGPWSAHMYLMFRLHRRDVWPVGDLGVRSGFARIHGLADLPAQKELELLGEHYRPWRSAAAFYCWRALETELP